VVISLSKLSLDTLVIPSAIFQGLVKHVHVILSYWGQKLMAVSMLGREQI